MEPQTKVRQVRTHLAFTSSRTTYASWTRRTRGTRWTSGPWLAPSWFPLESHTVVRPWKLCCCISPLGSFEVTNLLAFGSILSWISWDTLRACRSLRTRADLRPEGKTDHRVQTDRVLPPFRPLLDPPETWSNQSESSIKPQRPAMSPQLTGSPGIPGGPAGPPLPGTCCTTEPSPIRTTSAAGPGGPGGPRGPGTPGSPLLPKPEMPWVGQSEGVHHPMKFTVGKQSQTQIIVAVKD